MDVHPPHEAIHTLRQFLMHLLTITIGLLIALALEHWAEYIHERHLVHEAERRVRIEIQGNSNSLANHIQDLQKQDEELKGDLATLRLYAAHRQGTERHSVNLHFSRTTLDNAAWVTARSNGALSYMSYEEAQKMADVYAAQDMLMDFERQSVPDTAAALGLLAYIDDAANPIDKWTQQQYETAVDRIGRLRAQVFLVNAVAKGTLDTQQKYLKEH
jgi:hypothetical protein